MSEKLDICLVMCPPYGPESPPLSLASLVEAVRHKGFTAHVEDVNIRVFRAAGEEHHDQWSMDIKEQWVWPTRIGKTWETYREPLEACIDDLASVDTDTYGFSCHSDNRLMTQEVIRHLKRKKPDAFCIVGGMGVVSNTDMSRFDRGLVDAFVFGPEGENTLCDLLDKRRKGESIVGVPGVFALLPGGRYSELTERKAVENLDVFPWPTFEDFDLSMYTTPNLPLITSRGCRSRCLFCNDRVLMGPQRNRTAENILEEMKYHLEHQGVRDYSFNDLQLNYNLEEVDKLCRMIVEWGEEVRWNCNMIISESLTLDILKNFKAAGCHTITLGLESGSPKIV
ncbi:radical SAM protein, partial [bacterium]|nr:radical SAM protein [bacterium]